MLQGVLNQSQNMAVRKGVVDVFCFPPPFNEPRGVESLEASGNGAQFLVFQFCQFRHADLAGGKPRQQLKPGWFAESPEHCRRIIELTGMRQLWPGAGRVVGVLTGSLLLAHQCSIIPSTDGMYSLRMDRQGCLESNSARRAPGSDLQGRIDRLKRSFGEAPGMVCLP